MNVYVQAAAVAGLFTAASLTASAVPQAPAGPPASPEAVARGRQMFTAFCSTCHGVDARGGAEGATDLTQSPIATANDGGSSLGAFLKVGRPERRMPPFPLVDADVADLSAFLRSIAAPAARGGAGRGMINAMVVGDAKAGEAYFNGAGRCHPCHSPAGDLKGIGSRLPVAAIQGRLVLPRGNGGYPPSFNSPPNRSEAPRTVTVTMRSGEKIAGTLMWVTDFHVTLRDASGMQRTIARNGETPEIEIVDPLQYHLDHMRILTDKDMHDLTAYLVTLK
jgi:cytochrome c oxidase cbb3-type subunit 3